MDRVYNYMIDNVPQSFRLIKTLGNGACFFNTLSLAIYGTDQHSLNIRLAIVRHIVQHYQDYSVHPGAFE